MVGGIVFLLAAAVSGVIVWQLEQHSLESERAHAARLAADHAHSIEHTIEHTFSASQALAALVYQGNGNVPRFDVPRRHDPCRFIRVHPRWHWRLAGLSGTSRRCPATRLRSA